MKLLGDLPVPGFSELTDPPLQFFTPYVPGVPRKVVDFITIYNIQPKEFDKEVLSFIRAGYEFHGNPYCDDGQIYQTMVKYE